MDEKIRNFDEDLASSNNKKLREDWIKIFKLKFGDDCEIEWKDELNVQKGFGTDITIKTKKGRRYSIELKTRNNNCFGKDYIMEIVHQVYTDKSRNLHLYKKEGWIYTTTAEYIFHATLDKTGERIVECIFYSLSPFKNDVWKSEFDKYSHLWLPTIFRNGNYQITLNKLIPKDVIKSNALEFWEWSQ